MDMHRLPGSAVNNGTLAHSDTIVAGWVSSPNSRGSINIIWESLLTIFLCTWTAVCLNIPHPDDTKLHVLLRKAKWLIWAIVGPEIVLSIAIGQFASARRSVRRFKRLGFGVWTLRHAFFADMGGMLLQPKNSSPFLVNARQLAYLLEKDYIKLPSITAEEIWDKSKADTLTKIITLAQTAWLAVQLIGRAAQHLETTTLELSAGAIVLCTTGTFICWLHKPADVQKGIVVTTDSSTAEIILRAGDIASRPYTHTPLDFVAKQSFTCSYDVMRRFNIRYDNETRPLRRFPNDRFPDISTFEKFALFCMTVAYAAFHLIGWNFTFPSRVELLLWRISSSILTGTTLTFWIFETIAARQRFGRWDKYLVWLHLKKAPVKAKIQDQSKIEDQSNIDPDDAFEMEQREAKPILRWELTIIVPVILIYAAARFYMIVEAFISLRRLPLGVYISVDFMRVLPSWQ